MISRQYRSAGMSLARYLFIGVFTFLSVLNTGLTEEKERINSDEKGKETPPAGVIGEALEEVESDYVPDKRRLIIPPYYQEKTEKFKLRLLFPLFVYKERKGEEGYKNLGIFPFYWRHRSKDAKTDVIFPLYWRYRGLGFKTDIVLQTYYNRSQDGYNIGFGPLFFIGKNRKERSSYQIIPPIFWRITNADNSFLLAGIFYHRKKENEYHLGLPPLFFAGKEKYKSYLAIPPILFFRFKNEIANSTKNIFPPFFLNTREEGWSFGAMPVLYLARNKTWDKTFVLPFYYGSRWPKLDKMGETEGEGRTHIFPLLLSYYRKAPGLSQGGAAVFYQWYWNKGDYMKMFTPLIWLYGNERTDVKSVLIPPLFYKRKTPVRNDLMVSLIYWDFHNYYRERTVSFMPLFVHNWNLYEKHWRTWVIPTFDIGVQPDGYHFRFHPIFYRGKNRTSDHLVFAPLLWKFTDEEDDDLVVFPFYWRFKDLLHDDSSRVVFPLWWQFDDPRRKNRARILFPFYWDIKRGKTESRTVLGMPFYWQVSDRRSKMTGVLNVFHNRGQIKGNEFWTFNIFPFVAFGKPPSSEGAYWSFLSGLVGWRRQGSTKQLKLFWIPINFKP